MSDLHRWPDDGATREERRVLDEHEPDVRDAGLQRREHVRGRRVAEGGVGGQKGMDGCVSCAVTGIQVDGSSALVGLKLAYTLMLGGSPPRSLTGAVKWPAVTKTFSWMSVPLAKVRSASGWPPSSTSHTMMVPTFGNSLSSSTVTWA